MKLSMLISAILLSATAFCQCAGTANIYSFTYNAHQYEVVRENRSWNAAKACAAARGGYLLSIDNAQEQAAVFLHVRDSAGISLTNTIAPDGGGIPYVWIGGSDLSTEGIWSWENSGLQFWSGETNGTAIGGLYNNWGTRNNREPDNFIDIQHALGLGLTDWPNGYQGEWNDIDPSNELYYVIEIPAATKIAQQSVVFAISITPNPSTGRIFINANAADINTISVMDRVGRLLKTVHFQNSVDMDDLADGVYYIRIEQKDVVETHPLILTK